MIKINLLPHKKVKPAEKGLMKLRAAVFAFTVLVILALGYGYFYIHSTISKLNERNAKAVKQLAVLKDKIKEVEGYEKTRLELENKLRIIKELEKRRVPLTPFMNEVNRLMPKEVWLTSLSFSGITFTFEGMGKEDRKHIDAFSEILAVSPLFKDVSPAEVKNADSKTPGVKVFSFKLTGKVAGYEEPVKVEPKAQGDEKKAQAGKPDAKAKPKSKPKPKSK